MTECTQQPLLFSSLPKKKIVADFGGGDITTNGGKPLIREADRMIGLIDSFDNAIDDPRCPWLIEHDQRTILAQRVFAIAVGYDSRAILTLLVTGVRKEWPDVRMIFGSSVNSGEWLPHLAEPFPGAAAMPPGQNSTPSIQSSSWRLCRRVHWRARAAARTWANGPPARPVPWAESDRRHDRLVDCQVRPWEGLGWVDGRGGEGADGWGGLGGRPGMGAAGRGEVRPE